MRSIAALLTCLLLFAVPAFAQEVQDVPVDGARPLSAALDADGSVRPGVTGAFDPAGYALTFARDGAPRFTAQYGPDSCGRWDDQFTAPGLTVGGYITAVLAFDGKICVGGGSFTRAGGVDVSNIALWDGTKWSSMDGGMRGVSGNVNALATDGTNIYAGGNFVQMGPLSLNNIARWDGTAWSALGAGANNSVYALSWHGGMLYVGGNFSSTGVPSARIARWNGATWSAVGGGLGGLCYAMGWRDDTLFVAGDFRKAGPDSAAFVAKWDGTTWSKLGSGLSSVCFAIAVTPTDVYAGGAFTTAGGVPASRIARWNGSSWSALGAGCAQNVYSIAYMNGSVYAGGDFTSAGGTAVTGFARWDGAAWSAVGGPFDIRTLGGNLTVRALQTMPDGSGGENLLVGGRFETVGGANGVGIRYVGLWDGAQWSGVGTGNGPGSSVINIVEGSYAGRASLYAVGTMMNGGAVALSRVGRFDIETSTWHSMGGANDNVHAVAVSGNDVYIGGYFTKAGGVPAMFIAKWNGTTWSPLGTGANSSVAGISIAPNGDVYAGGAFTTMGGVTVNRMARWNGTVWSGFGTGFNGIVEEIAFADNGAGGFDVYAVGQFTTAGGLPASRAAKWNGTSWSALGTGLNGNADALWVEPRAGGGHDVYVGGRFTTAGGITVNGIAKWDGTAWSAMGPGFDSSVHAIAVKNGLLYAGGNFRMSGADSMSYVATWDGTSWSPLARGLVGGGVDALVVTDTSLYVAGVMHAVGCGTPSDNFARLSLASATTAVDDAPMAPPGLTLSPPAPNPFRGVTTIAFRLPDARHVSLRVHDLAGREVAVLADGVMPAGRHELRFDARGLKHGVYFYTLRAGALVESRKMLIVR